MPCLNKLRLFTTIFIKIAIKQKSLILRLGFLKRKATFEIQRRKPSELQVILQVRPRRSDKEQKSLILRLAFFNRPESSARTGEAMKN